MNSSNQLFQVPRSSAASKELAHPVVDYDDLPGLGAEDYPGFPADECPAEMPGLAKHSSLMAEALKKDPDIYERLRSKKTSSGVSLARCVKPGMDVVGHPMIKSTGIVAGDVESYDVFGDIFDPVIEALHAGTREAAKGKLEELSALELEPLDAGGKSVVLVRAWVQRNLAQHRFPAAVTADQRVQIEKVLVESLQEFSGPLEGQYYPLVGSSTSSASTSRADVAMLEEAGLVFEAPDAPVILSSGSARNWPHARGVFLARNSNFAAWINEEDHLRLWTTQPDAEVSVALHRLVKAEAELARILAKGGESFAVHQRLGHLTSDVANLGSALRLEIGARLPNLSRQAMFKQVYRGLGLQASVRTSDLVAGGEDVWYFTNPQSLSSSEVDIVKMVTDGVRKLVELESRLSAGEQVDLSEYARPSR